MVCFSARYLGEYWSHDSLFVIYGFDLLSAGTFKVSLAYLYHVKSRLCACDGAAL